MSNIFDGIEVNPNASAKKETVGGNYIAETGAYNAVIKMARIVDSQSSASKALEVTFETESGATVKDSMWFVGKDGKTASVKDGKLVENFAFTKLKRLVYLATKADALKTESKQILVYNYQEKKEKAIQADVMVDLINKPVKILVLMNAKFKTKLDESTGEYKSTGETYVTATIVGFVDATTDKNEEELRDNLDAKFYAKWTKANPDDRIKDSTNGAYKTNAKNSASSADNGSAGTGTTNTAGGSDESNSNLFN